MSASLKTGRAAEVLLVEDNDCDAELTRIAFEQTGARVRLHHVWGGEDCMAFLRREGEHADAPAPDLILLDINMPGFNGHDVLHEIGADASLAHLAVVVLSTSDAREDVLKAYRAGCRSYVVKPVGFADYLKAVRLIVDYWFTLVELPEAVR